MIVDVFIFLLNREDGIPYDSDFALLRDFSDIDCGRLVLQKYLF